MAMQELSEEDTKYRYITPAIRKKNSRGEAKKADYLLHKNNIPLAIVEAKKYNKTIDAGLQQAETFSKKRTEKNT